jgi:uncharacterized protein DUF3558
VKPLFLGVVGGAVLLIASACDGTASGTPTPAGSTGASSTTSAPSATSRLLPPRPRDLDLAGVDPCRMLTVAQARELDYDKGYQLKPQPGTNDITGTPDCGFSSLKRGGRTAHLPGDH